MLSSLKVISWNILADCYSGNFGKYPIFDKDACKQPSSASYSKVLSWDNRFRMIKQCLKQSGADIICLQEVDHFEDCFNPWFSSIGYHTVYCQRPQRQDGCLIAYDKAKLVLEKSEWVLFDDICQTIQSDAMRETFERRNVAMLTKFKFADSKVNQHIVAANAHLYWNPNKPTVKQAQAVYLMERLEKFIGTESIPVVLGGDFNTLPGTEPYKTFTDIEYPRASSGKISGLLHGPKTKFLCDKSLIRLCRWLRVLGIDCATETAQMDQVRSLSLAKGKKPDFSQLFKKARDENRVILTTSKQMRERSNCPQSMLVATNKLRNLEFALLDVCKEFSLELNPEKFLTVCGKCGGEIEDCDPTDPRFAGLVRALPTDRPVYACANCNQPYWWNDRENSSPARAMKMADKLFNWVSTALAADHNSVSPMASSLLKDDAGEMMEPEPTLPHPITPGLNTNELSTASGSVRAAVLGAEFSASQAPGLYSTPSGSNLSAMFLQRNQTIAAQKLQRETVQAAGEAEQTGTVTVTHTCHSDGKNQDDSSDWNPEMNSFSKSQTASTRIALSKLEVVQKGVDTLIDPVGGSLLAAKTGAGPSVSGRCAEMEKSSSVSPVAGAEGALPRLPLCSAFVALHGVEPECTNWSGDFAGTLDYIFVSDLVSVRSATVAPVIRARKEQLEEKREGVSQPQLSIEANGKQGDSGSTPAPAATKSVNTEAVGGERAPRPPVARTAAILVAVDERLPEDTDVLAAGDEEGTAATASGGLATEISGPQPSLDWPSDHFILQVELFI